MSVKVQIRAYGHAMQSAGWPPMVNRLLDHKRGGVDLVHWVRSVSPSVSVGTFYVSEHPPLPCVTSDWITALAPSVKKKTDFI